MVFLAARVTGKLKGRLLTIIAMLAIVLLPLLSIGPVADQINKRVQSLQSVQNDDSFNVRVQIYIDSASMCLLNIPGAGLGSTGTSSKLQNSDGSLGALANFDSGFLNLPYVLGWPGTLLYVGGLLSLLMRVFKSRLLATDLFLCSAAAIVVGAMGQMLFINTLIGVQGMVFWTFLGVCLAQGPEGTPKGRLPRRTVRIDRPPCSAWFNTPGNRRGVMNHALSVIRS